jgi:hypothetical protein
MSKIIYLPLEHIPSRYTVHMDRDITEYLEETGKDFIKIYPNIPTPKTMKAGSFLDAEFTIRFKAAQIEELARLYREDVIGSGDVIWSADLWHPGLPESVAYMNYFAKKDVKLRGFIHAGSFTDTDFVRDMERWAKNFEDNLFDICDRIYCGSEFIKNDIVKKRIVSPDKFVVTGLPLDEKDLGKYWDSDIEKDNLVIFSGRNVDEKQPWLFEQLSERLKGKAEFINTQKHNFSKDEYYDLLIRAKVVVSYALQENFGFGVNEAVYLGCVPILPNRLVYPEFYDKKYLYNTFDESVNMVESVLNNYGDWMPTQENAQKGILCNDNRFIMEKWFNG